MPVKNPGLKSAASSTVEDYLERILELIDSKGYARVVDIAAALEISQASVTNMVQRLDAEGLLKYEKYRGLVLTPAGEKLARKIADRHKLLTDFLKLLGLTRTRNLSRCRRNGAPHQPADFARNRSADFAVASSPSASRQFEVRSRIISCRLHGEGGADD